LSTGVATTINQLASELLRTSNKTHLKTVHSESRKGDIEHSVADTSKARRKLHYDAKVLLKDSLEEFCIKFLDALERLLFLACILIINLNVSGFCMLL